MGIMAPSPLWVEFAVGLGYELEGLQHGGYAAKVRARCGTLVLRDFGMYIRTPDTSEENKCKECYYGDFSFIHKHLRVHLHLGSDPGQLGPRELDCSIF